MNFKKIPYKTEWLEYPDLEDHCKKLGIPPTSVKANGDPYYTLPAIHDPSTGAYLSNSFPIAEYLEATYPDTPSLFPGNTVGLQNAFQESLLDTALEPVWRFILPAVGFRLTPRGNEYVRRTREAYFQQTLEDTIPKGDEAITQWKSFKEGLGKVDVWYSKTEGPFLLGDRLSWADLVVGSWIIWMRTIWGEGSKEWNDISSWHNGRWGKLLDDLKQYQTIA